MPRKWQVWGQPDGSLVWIPSPDEPLTPPPAAAAAGPPDSTVPNPPPPEDARIEGPGGESALRVPSMVDLLVEVRSKLLEGDQVAETEVAEKGGLFCTGSGSLVAVSERSVKRARTLFGKEGEEEEANNNTKQPFDNVTYADLKLSKKTDVSLTGDLLSNSLLPSFQTGSGNAVSLREGSIQKARALLEDGDENAFDAKQPIFRTGIGRAVPVSRGSIDRARAVLEGQTIANEGDVTCVDGTEQDPLFQSGFGRAVPVNLTSIQKAKAVLEENNINKGNAEVSGRPNHFLMFQNGLERPALIGESTRRSSAMNMDEGAESIGQWDPGCLPIFQTGLGRPVAVKQSSLEKAKTVLEGNNSKKTENGDASVCAVSFQTETPKSVLMSSSLITSDRTITPEGNTAAKENYKVVDHLPLFQTGSGRSVAVSKTSIKRASLILEPRNIAKELEDEAHPDVGCATSMLNTGCGRSVLASKDSKENTPIVLEAEEGTKRGHEAFGNPFPKFQTGSGKSVFVSERSVQKARAVLEEECDANRDKQKLVNMEKKFPIFYSPLKTSSIRAVNVSSFGVSHAATLLGLEESTLSTQFFGQVGEKLGAQITVEQENSKSRLASENAISIDSHKGFGPSEKRLFIDRHEQMRFSKISASDSGENSIRFSTAGGRSMAISRDALRRAKNLLGELEDPQHDSVDCYLVPASKEKLQNSTIYPRDEPFLLHTSRAFGHALTDTPSTKDNANTHVERECHVINEILKVPKPRSRCIPEDDTATDVKYNTQRHHKSAGALVDITNYMAPHSGNKDHFANGKRKMEGRSSISPFKRPRSSRFITPIKNNKVMSAEESKLLSAQISPCRTKLSTCYPFQHQRKTYKEYFGGPPCFKHLTEYVTDEVKFMDPKRAEKYKFQHMGTGANEFQKMLLTCGASLSYASKEWVINHYKWIVWKLASLERCYPTRAGGKFLTVANVFEELKYRYDREVNHGHQSAIKKILEGNASPTLMMVLCVSAVYSSDLNKNKMEVNKVDTTEDSKDNRSLPAANNNTSAKIELTDGWYSLDASLDVALSEQLEKRKLFLGQKLRIWGASLCGWSGPMSFSEASGTVKLVIHINGTYRARWNEHLGFCKHVGLPLTFKCIKASGGKVPRTLVGVTRIYPVLYRERLSDGRSIVRSERMERKALELYQQRASKIAEDILFEQEENCDSADDDDDDEGAKICKMLERAAEPEAIMAGMTSEQLMHFSSYKEKQNVVMQNKVVKKIEKALEVADLSSRDVTPFLKVRVVGLVSKGCASKDSNKEGLITIWNPTEMQKTNLMEGQVYSVTGLLPSNYCTATLYLHARGSSTIWKPVAPSQTTYFKPFYSPRKAIELSKFGEVPLSSEFDIAGIILYVGNIYLCSSQKRQWLFLTDGSKFISGQKSEDKDCLLAVSISSPATGEDPALFSYALNGSIVGFSNLVKRQKDQIRQIWVAEATESSTFTLSHEISRKSHLKEAATSAERWASRSYPLVIVVAESLVMLVPAAFAKCIKVCLGVQHYYIHTSHWQKSLVVRGSVFKDWTTMKLMAEMFTAHYILTGKQIDNDGCFCIACVNGRELFPQQGLPPGARDQQDFPRPP